MKIALYGATGNIGRRILKEALNRGHMVTAIVRDVKKIDTAHSNLKVYVGDILDQDDVSRKVKSHNLVISAYGSGSDDPQLVIKAYQSLNQGMKNAGVKRLILVGGAGSLTIASGMELVDTPQFPPAWKAGALAHRDVLRQYRKEEELEWTYASPAALIEPGNRTGKFRWGTEQLVTDQEGNSKISMEDFAIAILDEAEQGKHIRKRFTVSY
ncbi:MAG TPA: NAD(P)-dependent oxidoreductase [Bacteroidales bacterium]